MGAQVSEEHTCLTSMKKRMIPATQYVHLLSCEQSRSQRIVFRPEIFRLRRKYKPRDTTLNENGRIDLDM